MGFLGNIGSGIQGIASGAVGLVGNAVHDTWKEIAGVVPGHQAVEEDPFRLGEMVTGLAGFTDHGFHPLDESSLLGGIYHRWEPLLPGGTPAHEAYQSFYDNPVAYGLDALGAGKVLGKTAEATLGGAIESGGLAAKAAETTAQLSKGFSHTPALRAGMRSALDELAAGGELNPLQTALRHALPKSSVIRVADSLEPTIEALNPVARAVTQNRFVSKLGTEPITTFTSRVDAMKTEIDNYLTNRGWKMDDAGQVVDRQGTAVATKAPTQLLQMAEDYRLAKRVQDAALEARLTRIRTDKAAHSVAGSVARKMLGQLNASGVMARNERIADYVNTITPDIVAHPEIAAKAAAMWQGLDVTLTDVDPRLQGTSVLDELGQPRRLYHGTANTFENYSPDEFGRGSLYGPGVYMTDNPNVASTYAKGGGAPQVRGAFAGIKNPFDMGKVPAKPDVARILEAARDVLTEPAFANLERRLNMGPMRGEDLWESVRKPDGEYGGVVSPSEVNAIFEQAGFDGFTHLGGQITGGEPHQVYIAFHPDQVVSSLATPVWAASRAGWVGRPLEWGAIDQPRQVALGATAPYMTDIPAPVRSEAMSVAPEWLTRTDDLTAGWQGVRQHMTDYPDQYVGTDVATASGFIDEHIDKLNRGVDHIVRAERGELDPAFATAAKVNIVSMEQTRKLWEMGVLTPQGMFERAMEGIRVSHGAKYNHIDDVWEGGPDPLAVAAALRAADTPSPIYFPHIDPASIGGWDFFRSKKLRGAVSASADPSLMRNQGKLLEQGSYITDPIEAFSRRAARAVRAEETYNVMQTMALRWGRELAPNEIKGSNEVYWIPEIEGLKKRTGLSIQDTMDDMTSQGLTVEVAAQEAIKVANDNVDYVRHIIDNGGPAKVYAVPRAVADTLDDAAKWAKAFGPNTKFGAYYDSYMNMWRHLTLFTRPAYVMNQFLGNTVWNQLDGAGLHAPAEIIVRRSNEAVTGVLDDALQKMRELPGFKNLDQGYSSSLERTFTPRNPKFEGTAVARLTHRIGTSKVAHVGQAYMETERKMAVELDNAFKAGGYINAAERAMGVGNVKSMFGKFKGLNYRLDRLLKGGFGNDASIVKEALDRAKRVYGDFNSMTSFERHVIRRYMFPWWGFTRHNIKLMLTYPIDYPGRAELMQAITVANQTMNEQYGEIPDYLQGSIPFGPPGASVPFFSTRGASPFEGAMQNPLSQLAPLPGVGYQMATGRNSFTDMPFTAEDVITPYGSDQQYRIMRDDAGNVTGVVPVDGRVTPGFGELLARTFPLYSYAERFASGDASTYDSATLLQLLQGEGIRTDSDTGEPIDQEGRLSVLGSLLGVPMNEVDLAGYQERLDRERKAALTAAISRAG